jgi:hypothetical protein
MAIEAADIRKFKFFRMPAWDSNPGNANIPIGRQRNAIQENGVPGES